MRADVLPHVLPPYPPPPVPGNHRQLPRDRGHRYSLNSQARSGQWPASPKPATMLLTECESAEHGAGWQVADLLVELAEQIDADDEVDRLDVGEPDLAAQDGGDLESVPLRGGRRDALAFRARCQPGEQVPILPLGDVERGRQVLRAHPFPGERGFQGVQPPEPVVGAEEDITKGRGEYRALVANPHPLPPLQRPLPLLH